MDKQDPQLTRLLRQWRDIEPTPNFEAAVWRRIRLAESAQPRRAPLADILCEWIRKPAYVTVFAVMLGASIGLWAGVLSTPPRPSAHGFGSFQFLGGETLSGGYVQLAERWAR
jgi:hypothetical protein